MSTAQFTIPLITVIPGQLITASLWNNEYNNLNTNLNALGIGAYSDTDPQMQTATDPFPSGTSRPTSLAGELERLRFQFVEVIGGTYWYNRPADNIFNLDTRITTVDAKFPVQTADIGDLQITNAKINDVAFGKITGTITPSDGTVTTAKIVDGNVTDVKILTIAASKITGQIVASQITDANVTSVKLESSLRPKQAKTNVSSFVAASSVNGVFGTVLSVTGAGALKGISLKGDRGGGPSGTSSFTIRITLDGTSYTVSGLTGTFTSVYSIINIAWASVKPPTLSNFFTATTALGTGADFYYGFNASLLIELRADSFSDGNNGFYVATSYEN